MSHCSERVRCLLPAGRGRISQLYRDCGKTGIFSHPKKSTRWRPLGFKLAAKSLKCMLRKTVRKDSSVNVGNSGFKVQKMTHLHTNNRIIAATDNIEKICAVKTDGKTKS